jgi:hypothetical protein
MNRIIGLTIAAISISLACCPPAQADEFNRSKQYVCSTAQDTYIRDYPTFKPVAKLQRGECMDILPIKEIMPDLAKKDATVYIESPDESSPAVYVVTHKGIRYFMVKGISGNVRLISTRHSQIR